MLHFVLLSLLVHALALQLKFDIWPKFPVDRGSPGLSVELPAASRIPPLTPNQKPSDAAQTVPRGPAAIRPSATPSPENIDMRPPAPAIDTTDLIERSKTELNAASRRQMLDPMFAPAVRQVSVKTLLERATAIGETKIEELGPSLFRITRADGSRYCLLRQPEMVTRDIPVPVADVPMQCQ
ncbi:MAG: hypothetical protein CVU31_03735 [Betaproteobacteria bacterium HGW-Betaproteobacteria-4]|nr:MAG: hypothetical protein CVU31_03735 [Betaproteobacteria bacterium HGW-Betaproteobacteria-4]